MACPPLPQSPKCPSPSRSLLTKCQICVQCCTTPPAAVQWSVRTSLHHAALSPVPPLSVSQAPVPPAPALPAPWEHRGLPVVKASVIPTGSHCVFPSAPSNPNLNPAAPTSQALAPPALPLLSWRGLAGGSLLGALPQPQHLALPSPLSTPLPPIGVSPAVWLSHSSETTLPSCLCEPSLCPACPLPSTYEADALDGDWLGANLPLLCLDHLAVVN